ncbi:TATA-box-binding protein, partial [Ascosphaera pollenicola]
GSLALTSDQAASSDIVKTDDIEQWNSVKVQLQDCVNAKDTSKFDDIVRSEFPKLSAGSSEQRSEKKAKHMPSPTKFFDTDKILFLLSRIFTLKRVRDSTDHKLAITFLPSKTFHWLVNATYFTFSNVKLALRQFTGLETLPYLKPGAMIQAIIEAKPSLRYLNTVLRGPVHLDADELVYTIQACLDIARQYSSAPADGETRRALAEKPQGEETANGETSSSTALVVKANPSGSEAILTNAVAALNLSLTRLESIPQAIVTTSIRANLSNSDTLSIIHHLRHALATGGYTARFVETGPAPFTHAKVPTLSLSTI